MLPTALVSLALLAPDPAATPDERAVDAPDAVVAPDVETPPMEPSGLPPTEPTPAEIPDAAPTTSAPPPAKLEVAPAASTSAPAVPPPTVAAEHEPAWKAAVELGPSRWVPGKGIEFASKDGRFALQLRARVQFRYDIDNPGAAGKPTQQTLQVRRARLQLQGHVFGKHNKYYIQLGFSPRDQLAGIGDAEDAIRRTPLRDARLEFDYLRDFTIWTGQMKVPFSRQRVISSGNMNLVDRSIANDEFQIDRDVGIQALSKDIGGLGLLAYNAGVFLGEGRNVYKASDFGMLYVARFEVTPFGKFDDYSEGDLERMKKPGLSIGGAYAYQDRAITDHGTWGDRFADGGTSNMHNITADVMFKWKGLAFESAFHMRKTAKRKRGGAVDDEGNPIATTLARDGVGWFAQLGYVVPKIPLEVVGRYGFVRNTAGKKTSSLLFNDEAGGGINYYFAGHNLKLQLDYFRLWGEADGKTYAAAAKHGNDRIRLQLQVAF